MGVSAAGTDVGKEKCLAEIQLKQQLPTSGSSLSGLTPSLPPLPECTKNISSSRTASTKHDCTAHGPVTHHKNEECIPDQT